MKLCGFLLISRIKGNIIFLVKIRSWMNMFAAVVFRKHTPDLRNVHKFKYESSGGSRDEPQDFILVH